ncbi:hypothetical protein JQC92_11805 [Shewanella sp. 202IG2-18]|uniref:hypothetical protein n=1 Tax=Parashewanella hymeniacidonis TaxID=2807618 RepID=UPI0019604577|nr:hypothetical protein [Parashewanella hymeniacidonis]MBM7072707.1 hypothetical protein [Parashewanella hymeniacidonis]
MNLDSNLSYNSIGQTSSASTSVVPVNNPQSNVDKGPDSPQAISGELVEHRRQPHTQITIEQWQHSRVHIETSNPISNKAISQYLLTQFAVERENIRQNIGIDTYA